MTWQSRMTTSAATIVAEGTARAIDVRAETGAGVMIAVVSIAMTVVASDEMIAPVGTATGAV